MSCPVMATPQFTVAGVLSGSTYIDLFGEFFFVQPGDTGTINLYVEKIT